MFSRINKLKNKIFIRLIIIFSLICVISISLLTIFICSHNRKTIINNKLTRNQSNLNNIDFFIDKKLFFSKNLINYIYSDKNLNSHTKYLLKYGQRQYFEHSLDEYYYSNFFSIVKINDFIDSCFYLDDYLKSIIIYSKKNDHILIQDSSGAKSEITKEYEKQLITLINKKEPKSTYLISYKNKGINNYSIIIPYKDNLTLTKIGYLIFTFDTKEIIELINTPIYNNDSFFVYTTEGNLLFNFTNLSTQSLDNYFIQIKNSKVNQFSLDNNYVNFNNPRKTTNLFVAGLIPKNIISDQVNKINRIILITGIILIVLVILTSILSILKFSIRINEVIEAMNKVKKGDLSIRIPIEHKEDEIVQISENFNMMCNELSDYIDKYYLAKIKQQDAELLALQAQINPHFLYNTLEVIRMKAIANNQREIGEMVYILANLFRYSVKNKTIITISEEIEHCKLYLHLFQLRFKNNFSYSFDVPENIMNYSIVNLSLQPIIENYILHGFKNDIENNYINVKAYKEDYLISFEIVDNGKGIDKENLEELHARLKNNEPTKEKKSIGLSNINERIKITYGNKYGIFIDDNYINGTKITLKIPALKKELVIRNV